MAEYKNGVTPFGNVPVTKETVAPEVKTGRAVFVDEDLYQKDNGYKAKVDKCIYEGFHRVSDNGSGSGSVSGGSRIFECIRDGEIDGGSGHYYEYNITFSEAVECFENGIQLIYKSEDGPLTDYSPLVYYRAIIAEPEAATDEGDIYGVQAIVCGLNGSDPFLSLFNMSAASPDDNLHHYNRPS